MQSLVSISLGSNINPEQNIRQAVSALQTLFGTLTISPVYKTEAVGFDGDDFLNLVVSFTTSLTVHEVVSALKAIEDKIGRDRSQPRFSSRLIDLDLLTYADLVLHDAEVQVPRSEILQNAFVLKPLSDIHAGVLHPELQLSYQQLWEEMRKKAQRIDYYAMTFE
jgi:2-amino-4-hydroxy-6-hydroxymethyldihydropteridine diphosphokinase